MVFKPNYNMQRAERNRAKQAKKDEKLREKEETAARRKAELESGVEPSPTEGTSSGGTDGA